MQAAKEKSSKDVKDKKSSKEKAVARCMAAPGAIAWLGVMASLLPHRQTLPGAHVEVDRRCIRRR